MHLTELVGVRSVLLGCAAAAVMLLPTAPNQNRISQSAVAYRGALLRL